MIVHKHEKHLRIYFDMFFFKMLSFYLDYVCDSPSQVWSECGTLCTKSCSDVLSPDSTCKENTCIEGCTCPEGHVVDESTGNCVLKSRCGCMSEGITYLNGESVKKGCNVW